MSGVFLGKRRAYQRKVAVADFDGICSSDILTFEPKTDELLPDLLPFIVQSEEFFEHALGTSSGSLSPRTRWSQLKEFEFALPPKDEQRRIAEALWSVDQSIQAKQRLIESLEVSSAALTSHLVLSGTGQEELKDSEVGRIPKTWSVSRLPSIVRRDAPITYGIVQPGKHDPNGVLMILAGDFINRWTSKANMFRVQSKLHQQYRRSLLSPGDIIMCIVGVTTGAVDIVPDWGEEANLTQTSTRISCDRSKVMSEFLLAYFRSSISRTFVTRHLKGSRQVRLNIDDFDNFMVPLPSLDELRRMVVVLKSFEDAKASAATSLASQKKLASSLSKTLLRGDTGVH
jgi:type I restriction enzyme, S subunit